jgi:hypothetical protein
MKKWFGYGGIVASVILIAFGVAAIVLGFAGQGTVRNSVKNEQITGTPDMTPAGIKEGVAQIVASQQKLAAAQVKAGVPVAERFTFTEVKAPSCSVAGKVVNTGERARCFAAYMRIHALEATNGLVYAQMGRYRAVDGAPIAQTDFSGGTSNPEYALTDPKTGQPVTNGARDLWVTETALTTALNTSYFAEQVALFSMIMGLALLLTGIGFLVLTLGGALGLIPVPKRLRATHSAKPAPAA